MQLSDKEPATRSFLSPSAILPAHMRDREIQAIEGLLADADRLEKSLESDRPEKVCLWLCPAQTSKRPRSLQFRQAYMVCSIRMQDLLIAASVLAMPSGGPPRLQVPVLTHPSPAAAAGAPAQAEQEGGRA